MMHYDIKVNDDCEIRLSGDQTFDEAQADQQTFTRTRAICQEMRTQVPARRKAAVRRAYSTRTTITFPSELNAAIENWRKLQQGRPKLATAILALIAAWLSATAVIHERESDPALEQTATIASRRCPPAI